MAQASKQHLREIARSVNKRRQAMWLFTCLALFVAVSTWMALRMTGSAFVQTKQVLDCTYSGVAAHTHTTDCYDENGDLVCPLPERELHQHDESCYDEEGNLICGMEELTEEHVHGPGCFVDVPVETEADSSEQSDGQPADEDPEPALLAEDDGSAEQDDSPDTEAEPMPAQAFSQEFADEDGNPVLTVEVDAPEGALPEGSSMHATWASDGLSSKEQAAVEEALSERTDGRLVGLQAVEVAFVDAQEQEVVPAKKVTMTLTSDLLSSDDKPFLVQVDDPTPEQASTTTNADPEPDRTATVVDALTDQELDEREMALGDNQLAFENTSVSTSVIAMTSLAKTLEASDGSSYAVTVEAPASAGVRQSDALEVTEIGEGDDLWKDYVPQIVDATGEEPGYIRLFDISIVDEEGSEVKIAAPVDVQMELSDASQLGESAYAVHMGSDGVELLDASVAGDTVNFVATGFSAYAIVDGPSSEQLQVESVADLDELAQVASSGKALYMSLPDSTGRSGITTNLRYCSNILKSNGCFTEVAFSDASEWYFEPVDGTTNQYRIYTQDGNAIKYMKQVNATSNNMQLTETSSAATVFELTEFSNERFQLVVVAAGSNKKYLQHSNSGQGIRLYDGPGDDQYHNSEFKLEYKASDLPSDDPYGLDGATYGLMSWDGNAAGKAMQAKSSSANALDALPLTVMTKTGDNEDKLFVPNDSDATMWTFEWVSGDKYRLKATVDGSTQYLRIDANGPSMVSEPDAACNIKVIPGTGTHAGQVCLKANNTTLTYSGNASTGFTVGGSVGTEWLNLVEQSELTSEYFMIHSARKVSVSDPTVTDGSRIIVYTRSWNDETKKYEFYAINSDGTVVRCFESGDDIQWVGGQLNSLLWNFVEYYDEATGEPNYFYELYNQFSEKYVAPLAADDQILSSDPVGINLNGRRNGQYYSSILAWDTDHYSYTGLKVEDGRLVPCPKSEAMDFYFAIMQDLPIDDELHTVKTVDNNQHGITMKMIDKVTRQEMSDVLGNNDNWDERNPTKLHQGLLSTNLDSNGYPTTSVDRSLEELYHSGTGQLREVNHLFIDSTYRSNGYFEYDSAQNFASLKDDNDFKVYRELGTYDSSNRSTYKHGQFFPFNDIEAGVFASVNGKNLYPTTGSTELPESDPRKYEQLYLIRNVDTFFAMELEASFVQTPSGLDAWGHDIIYEFTGDDDFWLYVDGELVIDLGGIHSAVPGSVNFRTGDVMVNGVHTTLRDVFESNYRSRNSGASEADVAAYLAEYFEEGSTVFKDNSTHTMKIFYMERGAGASNLHMRFNLASIRPGTVQLSKQLSGVDTSESILAEFPYQVWYTTLENGVEVEHLGTPQDLSVFYKDTQKRVAHRDHLAVGGVNHDSVFMLKPGETAEIEFPEGVVKYRIVECGVNTQVYEEVKVNDVVVSGESPTGVASGTYKDYGIPYDTTDKRARVIYDNKVDPDAQRTLTFSKKLYDANGVTPITSDEDSTTFDFRLWLGTEFDNELSLANMHTYHVKAPDGTYCRWDSSQKAFVSLGAGKDNYEALSAAEKASASFTTSMNGSITKIPVDYTVELREVLAGTQYMVQERENEVPDGYSFQRYVLYPEGVEGGTETIAPEPTKKTVVVGSDPHVDVCNLKGWGLRVNKVWTDEDYMTDRDPTYFALYYRDGHGHLHLVPDTDEHHSVVRQLTYGEETLYWYYLTLPVPGTTLDQYEIYEVRLNGPAVDEEGNVTSYHGNPHIIDDGYKLRLQGTQKGETESSRFEYTALYERGDQEEGSNVRVDTVTNSRPGIVIRKQDWTGNPLAGASFSLDDVEGTHIGTFTSNSEGEVTVAFLRDDIDYTLTETKTPQGYRGLSEPMTIHVNPNNTITVNSADEDYFEIDQEPGAAAHKQRILTIKNRPYTLEVIKLDGDTGEPLSQAHFELHRQVTVDNVTAFDVNPMVGFGDRDLVTGEDGVVPKLDNTLPPGVYQLREKTPPSSYERLSSYVYFNVSPTGVVSLGTTYPEGVELTETEDESSADGTLSYQLSIPNYRRKSVSFVKVDVADPDPSKSALPGAEFDLYEVVDEVQSDTPIITGLVSDDTGYLTKDGVKAQSLSPGTYHLVETKAPDGYVLRGDPIVITVAAGTGAEAVRYDDGTSLSLAGGCSYDAGTSTYTLLITNSAGHELPACGGPGTVSLYAIGVAMVLGAVVALLGKRHA